MLFVSGLWSNSISFSRFIGSELKNIARVYLLRESVVATEMTEEIISSSPIFVYKSRDCGREQFVAFCADDILTLEECDINHSPNDDSVIQEKGTCVFLKSPNMTPNAGHVHLLVPFHEIMLRWMNHKESQNAK